MKEAVELENKISGMATEKEIDNYLNDYIADNKS